MGEMVVVHRVYRFLREPVSVLKRAKRGNLTFPHVDLFANLAGLLA